jgi:hypothetical protein
MGELIDKAKDAFYQAVGVVVITVSFFVAAHFLKAKQEEKYNAAPAQVDPARYVAEQQNLRGLAGVKFNDDSGRYIVSAQRLQDGSTAWRITGRDANGDSVVATGNGDFVEFSRSGGAGSKCLGIVRKTAESLETKEAGKKQGAETIGQVPSKQELNAQRNDFLLATKKIRNRPAELAAKPSKLALNRQKIC